MLFLFLLYMNPKINPVVSDYLYSHFIGDKFLNKDYIYPKHLSNSWLEKYRNV